MNLRQKCLCFLLLFTIVANAQHNNNQAAFYNIISGAVVGGLGAIINKNPNQKFGEVVWKGMGQGALGGYVVFESKRLIGNFADSGNYANVWPSKILNAAGNSIILNAASNRNFWERYYLNISFVHLEYDLITKKKFNVRILPYSFLSGIYGFTQGKLDAKRTLYTGQLFFVSNDISDEFRGVTFANHIMLSKTLYELRKNTIAHEIIHAYQYEGLMGLNAFFPKTSNNLNQVNLFGKKYGDIFYTDWNGLVSAINHGTHLLFNVQYEDRFYEKEAAFYARPK